MKKSEIIENKLINNIVLEKNILQKSQSPFVVKLKYAFQTDAKIYLVMDYIEGGDLFALIRRQKKFSEKDAKFYLSEIILGIQYLHDELNVIWRDLKPENILLTAEGHVKLTDFGLSKQTEALAFTYAGTAEYLSPEIIENKYFYN